MAELMHRYNTEAQCEATLISSRLPQGFICTSRLGHLSTPFGRAGRTHWPFRRCRHQTKATANTISAATKRPLKVTFLARHRLTQAGKKVPFVIGIPTVGNNRTHEAAIHCRPFTKHAISQRPNTALHANTLTWSDALPTFRALASEVAEHHLVITGSGWSAAEHAEFRCVNNILGKLRTVISGTYRALNFAKYAPRYLARYQYRSNHHYNRRTILPRLAKAAARTAPRTES